VNFFQKIWEWIRSLFWEDSTPAPAPVPVQPSTGWQITHSSTPVPAVVNDGFYFPLASNADVAWVSYFELPLTLDISASSKLSITYTLTGNNPVFDHSSPNNVSTGPSTISVLLHRAGDDLSGRGSMAYYRWFSPLLGPNSVPLQLGTHTIEVDLNDVAKWGSLADAQYQWFKDAQKNLGSIGVVFGGGDFYSHGVCVTSGSAHFHLDSFSLT
jgi:hypothetical protein